MKKNLFYLLCVCTLLCVCSDGAAALHTNIRAEIKAPQDTGMLWNMLSVQQDFIVPADSAALNLELRHTTTFYFCLNPITRLRAQMPRLQVRINDTICNDFTFDGAHLHIPLRTTAADTVRLLYDCYAANNRFDEAHALTLTSWNAFDAEEGSWYFLPIGQETAIDTLEITLPRHLSLFTNMPYQAQNSVCTLTPPTEGEVSLFLLTNNHYHITNRQTESANIDVWCMKNITVDSISADYMRVYCTASDIDSSTIRLRSDRATHWIGELCRFFNDSTPRHITISDGLFSDGITTFAQTIRTNGVNDYLYGDTSAWNNGTFVHELTHLFFPDYTACHDSARFFFNESLVEYISKVIYSDYDSATLCNNFQRRYDKLSTAQKACPVLTITDNSVQYAVNEEDSTVYVYMDYCSVIYKKAPYILHLLAQRVGQERFLDILKGYIHYIREERLAMSLSNFNQFLTFHGISNEDWEWFITQL